MVQKYELGWIPQTREDLPKPEIKGWSGTLESLGTAIKSGLNERFVALGIDAYNDYKATQSELTIPEEEWTSSNIYWREGIDWTPDMTVDKAKIMSEIYDSDMQYLDLKERSGTFQDALRGTTWFTTMMVADEINLIPFVGQIAKGAQIIKAGTRLAKLGNKLDIVGKGLAKVGVQGGVKESIGRGAVYTAGFSGVEQFGLYPGAEKYRRNREVKLKEQLINFGLATATGGAIGGIGYGIGKLIRGSRGNNTGMNIDDIDTGTVQKIAQDLKNTRDKVNKINATTETVNNINRVDVDGDDFGNVAINSNTGRQRFDSNGLKTNDPDAPISINTNAKTGVVTVTVTRDTLEFVINTLRKVLEEPFVNIKLKGKRAKRFTKAQLEDVDGILKSFNTKKRIQDTTETLTIVNIEGEKVGFILNRKTGEPVAYKQDKTGQWIPENAVNSKKLLHAVMADDPVVKKEILETTKVRTDSETTKTDDSEPVDRQPTYDVRNEHKTKTHEQVADDLTGDGYKNITTVEQLNSLPETVGVRKREAKAGDNGQTKVKVKEYDENGNVITRDKDISLITKEMSEFKKTTTALDKAKAKLEQFALCNLQTGI